MSAPSVDPPSVPQMLGLATEALAKMHRTQVHRDPWPEFSKLDFSKYPEKLRRDAALQWAGRARNEHGSIHQFTILAHALTEARAPLHLLGALARLITDEVRHAELCAELAQRLYPEGLDKEPAVFRWPRPRLPWKRPDLTGEQSALETWAAIAVLEACCFGETLSRPMLEAIAIVANDDACEAAARQILRDEQLHARFGWETLEYLLPRLDDDQRATVDASLPGNFGGFERTTTCGLTIADVAGKTVTVEAGDDPNLGTLTNDQYAFIFYATLEQEIMPALDRLGFDSAAAWATRG